MVFRGNRGETSSGARKNRKGGRRKTRGMGVIFQEGEKKSGNEGRVERSASKIGGGEKRRGSRRNISREPHGSRCHASVSVERIGRNLQDVPEEASF